MFSRAYAVSVLSLILALALPWPTCAQQPASPELAAANARYQAEETALTEWRQKALTDARKPYLAALDAEEQKATIGGKTDVLKAIVEEKQAVTGETALKLAPPPLLPRDVAYARAAYQRDFARVAQDFTARQPTPKSNYLRALGALEIRARAANDQALLAQISTEKLRLIGEALPKANESTGSHPQAVSFTGKNLAVNGDFSALGTDGIPTSWKPGGGLRATGTDDHGVSFVRVASGKKEEAFLAQLTDRPLEAKELVVSVKIRCPQIPDGGQVGVLIAERDADNKLCGHAYVCSLKRPEPVWKQMSGTFKLKPEAKFVVFKLQMESNTTADFADLRVEAK